MSASTLASNRIGDTSLGFGDTLASEWLKLKSLRSLRIALALGVLLSIAVTALVATAMGATYESWPESAKEEFGPMYSLVGMSCALIAFSVFGVLVSAGEYSSGMIRLTLTLTPGRGRVLAAKALLVTLILVPLGLVSVLGMFMVGQTIFGLYGVPTESLSDTGLLRVLIGMGVEMPFTPLLGLALGFILRSTAAAITATLALTWIPNIFGGLLPLWWQKNVVSLTPVPAVESISFSQIASFDYHSSPAVGAVVVVVWLVVALGGAWLTLSRRDA
jgi:ABC-2 type transport system permease protein